VVYLYRSDHENEAIKIPAAYAFALALCVAAILVIGTASAPWLDWAMTSVGSLF
jgi:hypothetical protein